MIQQPNLEILANKENIRFLLTIQRVKKHPVATAGIVIGAVTAIVWFVAPVIVTTVIDAVVAGIVAISSWLIPRGLA